MTRIGELIGCRFVQEIGDQFSQTICGHCRSLIALGIVATLRIKCREVLHLFVIAAMIKAEETSEKLILLVAYSSSPAVYGSSDVTHVRPKHLSICFNVLR